MFRIGRGSNEHHRHSPSRPLQQPPYGSGPTRCCSMRSLLANQDALGRTHQTLIGCMDHLCLSPPRLPSAPGRCGARRRKPPFRGKTPKTGTAIAVSFYWGNPLFFGLPFCSSITVCLTLPRLVNCHLNEFPIPSPHIIPRRGIRSPGPKKYEVATATAPTARTAFYPDTRWQGGGADGGCIFPAGSPPDLFRFSLLHRDGAGLNSSAFIRCSEPAH